MEAFNLSTSSPAPLSPSKLMAPQDRHFQCYRRTRAPALLFPRRPCSVAAVQNLLESTSSPLNSTETLMVGKGDSIGSCAPGPPSRNPGKPRKPSLAVPGPGEGKSGCVMSLPLSSMKWGLRSRPDPGTSGSLCFCNSEMEKRCWAVEGSTKVRYKGTKCEGGLFVPPSWCLCFPSPPQSG